MSHTLNFERCYLATGCNIRADNIALLLPESGLTAHYAALWQVAFADNQCWQESLHLDRLGIPGVSGDADYPPGVCLWRITELPGFCREVVASWLLRRKSYSMQLAALLTDETPCRRATLLDEPEAGCDWRDEIFITTCFDKNIWRSLRTVLANPAQKYRSDEVAELLVRDGRQHAADDELSVRHVTFAINALMAGQYRNGQKKPFGIADIVHDLRRLSDELEPIAELEQVVARLEQPRNRGIVCLPTRHYLQDVPPGVKHTIDLLLQLRFEGAPGSVVAQETRDVQPAAY